MANNKATNVAPYQLVNQQAVSASVTSQPTSIFNVDNMSVQLSWTGTLVGTFDFQISTDYGPLNQVGTWDSLPLSPAPVAAGSAGHWTVDLNQLSAVALQIVFNYTSGTGNLIETIVKKGL